ncbi:MAG: hypothetical protein ACE5F1_16935 [Planctomycetota bacterium]
MLSHRRRARISRWIVQGLALLLALGSLRIHDCPCANRFAPGAAGCATDTVHERRHPAREHGKHAMRPGERSTEECSCGVSGFDLFHEKALKAQPAPRRVEALASGAGICSPSVLHPLRRRLPRVCGPPGHGPPPDLYLLHCSFLC